MEAEVLAALAVLGIGLVLVAVEALMPGAYLLIPGGVCTVVGAYGLACPDDLYSWVTAAVAVVSAIPVTVFTFWVYRRLGSPEAPTTTVSDSLAGREGKVTVEVTPGNMRGKVRIGSDTWSAEADETIPVGTDVVVESAAGVHVHVRRK
ncbi:Membrane protein implicated in regulation of membrane protease activity [Thermoplasmatales archaeon BRNA1]|nr:Membrane protein implicated in regulation of membrane protease activity [Thermoplasmatales archaeon BRNA1]